MVVVFVLGNEFLNNDSAAITVAKKLSIPYIHLKSPDDLLLHDIKNAIILDTAINVPVPTILHIDQLKKNPTIGVHDFDVAFFLSLLKELHGYNIPIIAVPAKIDAQTLKQTKELLAKYE